MSEANHIQIEDLQSGGQFKHYQLLERIGYGGQAVIWSAFDPENVRVVAVKLNQLGEIGDADLNTENQLFDRQARLIAALDHPHILPLYDYGVIGRLRYMVMPYIAAGSLKDLLDSTTVSLQDNLELIAQIASALDYIHQHKIVHRDLKPTNILVDYNRNTYLADFGLARLLSQTTQPLHTGHGTPPYAPPEQHMASRLTPQSDLFSLGILFYEMLTKEIPWQGEKSLGILQLNDDSEALADPRDINADVPAGMVNILRRLTAADPAMRPPSASEALRLIRETAEAGGEGIAPPRDGAPRRKPPPFMHMALARNEDAFEVLRRGIAGWDVQQPGRYPLSLTRYFLVDAAYLQPPEIELPIDDGHSQFMLVGALLYGQRADYWWSRVADARQKVAVCASAIEKGDEQAMGRAVAHLSSDSTVGSWSLDLPPSAMAPLLNAAGKISDEMLIEQLLALLRRLVRSPSAWQSASFSAPDDLKLAEMALADAGYAAEATRLIGHVRSETAAQVILGERDPARRIAALVGVRQTAGSLPASIPLPVQLRVAAELLFRQLAAEPNALLRAFFASAAGSFFGFGAYVYITYRLPGFMDAARLLVALERGSFLGAFVGFGVFLTRAIVQRLTSLSLAERTAAGVIAGGLAILFSLFSYDVLFLDSLPSGWLIAAGSLMIAAGFGLAAGLTNSRWLRMLASGITLALALNLSWALHLTTQMTPILFYEYDWPAAQVLLMALVTAAPIAALGNVGELEVGRNST